MLCLDEIIDMALDDDEEAFFALDVVGVYMEVRNVGKVVLANSRKV